MNKRTEKLGWGIRDILTKHHNQVLFEDEVFEILQACKEAGLKFVPDELNIGAALNPHRDKSFQSAVAFDQGKFATRDAIISQIEEIDIEIQQANP